MRLLDGQTPTIWERIWRQWRIALLLRDLRSEHKALVRSFQKTLNPKAALVICTCMPGEMIGKRHALHCRSLL